MKSLQTLLAFSIGIFGFLGFMVYQELVKLNETQIRQADIAEAELMVSLHNQIEIRFNECAEANRDIYANDPIEERLKKTQEFCKETVSKFPEVEMINRYFGGDKLPYYVK